jgi:hypothetical protein
MNENRKEVTYDEVYGKEEHVAEMAGGLLAYVEKKLSSPEREAVEKHLTECAACRLEVFYFQRDVTVLERSSEDEIPSMDIEQLLFWEQTKARIMKFLELRLSRETMRRFDTTWRTFFDAGVLGAFHSDTLVAAHAREIAEDRLPALIGALSNMAANPKRTDKTGALELLEQYGKYSARQAQTILDEFNDFLKQESSPTGTE